MAQLGNDDDQHGELPYFYYCVKETMLSRLGAALLRAGSNEMVVHWLGNSGDWHGELSCFYH